MPLTKPALVHADPGRPITAQAWNAIVDAIGGLYDAVNALGGNTLKVNVTVGGQWRTDARVLAISAAGDRVVEAIPPFGEQKWYLLAGLTEGTWQLRVTAPGCEDRVINATVPSDVHYTVSPTPNQKVMPDLFGRTVNQALAALAAQSLTIDAILDTAGAPVPKLNPPASVQDAVVLWQHPAPNAFATASAAQVRLVVSAELESATVTVPNLAGLTLAEATKALNALGLKLGTTTIAKDK